MISAKVKISLGILLTALIFAIDCFLVPGYSFWLLYLSPFALIYGRSARYVYCFSVIVSILMIIGYFLPSVGFLSVQITAINRTSGILVVWLTAYLLQRTAVEINHAHQERYKLQRLIETLPAGVLFSDAHGEIVLANAAATEALGGMITGTAYGPQGRFSLNKLDGTLLATHELPLIRALEKGESTRGMPILVRYEAGGERILSADASPIKHDSMKQTGAVAVLTDITNSKRAEEALRQSESQFRQIAESLPQLIWITRPDGYHEYFNRQWYEFTGTRPGETAGEMWARLLHPDDYQRTINVWHHSLRTGEPYSIEYRFKRGSDGTYHWFIGRALPVRNEQGEISRWFGTCTYIQKQKKAEEELRISQERYHLINRATHDIIWDWDLTSKHLEWNESIEIVVGRNRSDMPQTLESWYQHIHPEDRDRVVNGIHKVIESTENAWSDEYRFGPSGGPYRIYFDRGLIARDKRGKAYRMIGSMLDLTERKQAEEALRKSKAELQCRAEELAASNQDLESFSYSVSHDLRNPLRSVGSFADLLMEDYADKLEGEGLDYLRRIVAGVRKMQRLIDDMLSLARIGRHEMNRQDFDLSTIARDYLQELKTLEPQRHVEFIVQDNVRANVDPRLIHLALENLLRNAWKFTAQKEIARIEFGTFVKKNETIYFVCDNGVGFDIQFAKTIFEPFKRVHAEREFGGTGVGLSIVQRVIRRHGGKVWAEGEVGKGAVFYFTLG